MRQSTATPSGRLEYLDLIRGLFILVMVEGHTLRALLSPEVQAGLIYHYQDFIHNLTGPAFLFASGAAFVYSTRPRGEVFRRWSPKLRGRLLRWLVVLIAAYALQLTYGTLRRSLAETTPEQLAFLLSLNILQCIIFSLLLLQLLMRMTPNLQWFFRVSVIAALVIGLLTPFAWVTGANAPVWLASLVSGRTRSIFPLFPYAGFALAGAAWGHLHQLAREQGREDIFLRSGVRYAAALCVGSIAVALLPLPEIFADFWYTSPLFFLLRVGILALIAVGARRLEPRLLARWDVLAMCGRQSLLIYVLHLPVLYGSAFNPDTSLVKWLGKPLLVGDAILVWLIFTACLVAIAAWWDWWRKDQRWQARAAWWLVAGYYSYRFFLA
ncbi:MAG: acyltransferase [Acidobacteria bacterium]|nr:acyltransferase [Acidobacteriota bacterium]